MANVAITAANVAPGADAIFETGVSGATITAGQCVYKDASDSNKFKLCDNDSGTAAARTPYGIAVGGASNNQRLSVQTQGDITIGGTVVPGFIYVPSATAGAIAPSADLVATNYTSVLGVARSATVIALSINAITALI